MSASALHPPKVISYIAVYPKPMSAWTPSGNSKNNVATKNQSSKELANSSVVANLRPRIKGGDSTGLKRILLFTSYFGMTDFNFGFGQKPFVEAGCPVNNCHITNDKKALPVNSFDAILFHPRNMKQGKIPLPNQKQRMSKQRYVMFLMESPLHDGFNNYDKFEGE